MTHEQLRDRLLDLAYGELAPADASEAEAHVAECQTCRTELERIQTTRRIMSGLPEERAPEWGEESLVAAARQRARVRPPARRWAALLQVVAVAASIVAVGTVSWRLLSVRPRTPGAEDRGALEGKARYAEPPPPAAPMAAEPSQADAVHAEAERAASARAKKAAAPPRATSPAPGGEVAGHDAMPEAKPERAGDDEMAEAKRERTGGAASVGLLGARGAGAATPAPAPETEAPPSAPPGAPRAAPAAPPPSAVRRHAMVQAAPEELAGPERAAGPAKSREVEATDAEARAEAADPVPRYEALRRSGRLTAEYRMAPGCTVEAWRRVERDPQGRIVAYAWDEERGGRRVICEVVYGPDGTVAARRAHDAETRAPVPADFAALPASRIDLDAPARCR